MPPICILTDTAAQFIHSTFLGKDLVQIIPLESIESNNAEGYRLSAPADKELQVILKAASQKSETVFAIISSGYLSTLPNQIFRLIKESPTAPRIVIIDSLSIGIGTGYLVEKTAEMAANGEGSSEIERKIRKLCSAIYTAVIMPELSLLVPLGLVDRAQANAAAILGIQSVFSMEEGLPTPMVKVRNRHNAYEYLLEFMDEFDKFHLVALVQESVSEVSDLQVINEHLSEFFPHVNLLSFTTNENWLTIFGRKSYGLVLISNEENV